MTQKPIYSGTGTFRFYEKDGWTKAELDGLCMKGEVEMPFPGDEMRYFVLKRGSYFDCKKLLAACSKLHRMSPSDEAHLSDLQYLERHNG